MVVDDTLLQDGLHSFPAPLDPRVQNYVQDTTPAGRSAYDLTLSASLDTLLKRTKTQRDQYNIQDCCVVVMDGDGELISMNMCRERDDVQ